MIACKVKLTKPARTIECLEGDGFFRFKFTTGRKIQTVKLTNDAAWIVGRMIDAMHPNITGSSSLEWRRVQELRKQQEEVK